MPTSGFARRIGINYSTASPLESNVRTTSTQERSSSSASPVSTPRARRSRSVMLVPEVPEDVASESSPDTGSGRRDTPSWSSSSIAATTTPPPVTPPPILAPNHPACIVEATPSQSSRASSAEQAPSPVRPASLLKLSVKKRSQAARARSPTDAATSTVGASALAEINLDGAPKKRNRHPSVVPRSGRRLIEYEQLLGYMNDYDFVVGTIGGFHKKFEHLVSSRMRRIAVWLIIDAQHQRCRVLFRAVALRGELALPDSQEAPHSVAAGTVTILTWIKSWLLIVSTSG